MHASILYCSFRLILGTWGIRSEGVESPYVRRRATEMKYANHSHEFSWKECNWYQRRHNSAINIVNETTPVAWVWWRWMRFKWRWIVIKLDLPKWDYKFLCQQNISCVSNETSCSFFLPPFRFAINQSSLLKTNYKITLLSILLR